jgi:hypothetical protein
LGQARPPARTVLASQRGAAPPGAAPPALEPRVAR